MTIRSLTEVRNKRCKGCELCSTAEFVCLTGYGSDRAKIMLIGEAPGQREDESGVPFVGRAGQVLDMVLSEVGLSRKKVYISNAVKCRPPDNRKPSIHEMRACRKYLLKEIKIIDPEFIITLGDSALKALFDNNNMSIGKNRGKILDWEGRKVMPTYHPAAALRKKMFAKWIFEDFENGVGRYQRGELEDTEKLNYNKIDSKNQAAVVKKLIEADVIVVDVETTSLDMFDWKEDLTCIGFSIKSKESYVWFAWDIDWELVYQILDNKKLIIGHNIKFDMKWLHRYGVRFKAPWFDTQVALHLLDENYPDKSLKHLIRTNLPVLAMHMDRAEQVFNDKDKGKDPSMTEQEWIDYNGGDCDGTYRLYRLFKKALIEQGFYKLFKQEMRNLKVLARMEIDGFQISREVHADLKKRYQAKMEESEKVLKRVLGDINFNSPPQLGKKLFEEMKLPVIEYTKTGYKVDEKSLLTLMAKNIGKRNKEAIQKLLDHRGLAKLYNTYIKGIETKGQLKEDGLIHCNFKICGTVTGRLSCAEPNLQNIPRNGDIKEMFITRFGEKGVLIQGDYSQAELRLLAHYSNAKSLIDAFKSGRDIHQEVAAKVFRKPYDKVTTEERKFTKQVNFGIVYLISPQGLAAKLDCSESRAKQLIDEWFEEFPEVKQWIRRTKQLVVDQGYTENIFGRHRRFFATDPSKSEGREDQRQGVNAPIQGGAGDLTKWVGTQVHHELRRRKLKGRVICNVHDSVIVDTIKSEQEETCRLLKQTAIHAPLKLKVPLEFDIQCGRSWAELRKAEVWKDQTPGNGATKRQRRK